jgi:heme-degrading monooxygenase HmoA
MFVLFVDMEVKPGVEESLKKTYTEIFRPAISKQDGFRGVELLRPNQNRNQDGGEYRLSITFQEHALQKKWVATDLHQDVWAKMEAHFASYTVKDYTSI